MSIIWRFYGQSGFSDFFILGFILLTNNLSPLNFSEVLKVATVIVVMGCISGLIAMLSGFLPLNHPKLIFLPINFSFDRKRK